MDEMIYPSVQDYLWLAVDGNGFLAAFLTAGSGPIAVKAIELGQLENAYMEHVVSNMPEWSTSVIVRSVPDPLFYRGVANRGIALYDWVAPTDGDLLTTPTAYRLVAVPSRRASLRSLPSEAAQRVQECTLSKADFSRDTFIRLDEHVSVIPAPEP